MMGLEGVTATTVTYNCVIDACANGGNPAKAAEIFQEMKERKVAVDQVTYGSLANAFAKCGQWESAVRVLEEMRRHSSVRPNNFVYCSVMSACNRANQWSVALALLDQLLKEVRRRAHLKHSEAGTAAVADSGIGWCSTSLHAGWHGAGPLHLQRGSQCMRAGRHVGEGPRHPGAGEAGGHHARHNIVQQGITGLHRC